MFFKKVQMLEQFHLIHIFTYYSLIRDEAQVSVLAHQLSHSKTKKNKFLTMYDEHMKQRYGYLVIDCTPQYHSEIKVHADIFPGQLTYTFDI